MNLRQITTMTDTIQTTPKKSYHEVIPLPEYGHHIQHMVDHCLTIEDRDERTRCAHSIVKAMAIIQPEQAKKSEDHKVLWDHLAVMSHFALDIDYPVEPIHEEALRGAPEPLSYPEDDIIYRHYGHLIQELIKKACEMPEGDEREALALSIANRMKQAYILWNKRAVDDYTIFKDLYELSGGKLVLTEEEHQLDAATRRTSQGRGGNRSRRQYRRPARGGNNSRGGGRRGGRPNRSRR